ncbi:YqaA family protein [Paralcaligenes ginsengisoli]
METWLESSIQWLLLALALPKVGLSAIFLVSLVSATLLPMGSEPAVFAYVKMAPDMFWPAMLVAAAGNTLGGMITYGVGEAAEKAYRRWHEKHGHLPESQAGLRHKAGGRWHAQISRWSHRVGPPILFFAWLPVVGDPLCAVAGWMRLSFWPCVFYMAVGKFLRYVALTGGLLWVFPHA